MTNEWYVEIRGDYPRPVDIHTQEQLDSLDRFYEALSEYLGGEDFEPAISSRAEAYETWVYIDAANSDEAAASATRMFGEASELVWGPGRDRLIESATHDCHKTGGEHSSVALF